MSRPDRNEKHHLHIELTPQQYAVAPSAEPETAAKLIAMNYDNLAVKETTIVG